MIVVVEPLPGFSAQPESFWAQVKLLSEQLGYSVRAKKGEDKQLRRYGLGEVVSCYQSRELNFHHLLNEDGGGSDEAHRILGYLNYRADVIEKVVEPNLMNREMAADLYAEIRGAKKYACSFPMNKQKGEKRHESYLTCIVNMLTEDSAWSGNG